MAKTMENKNILIQIWWKAWLHALNASCRVKSRQKKDEKEARANHTHALGGTYASFRESTWWHANTISEHRKRLASLSKVGAATTLQIMRQHVEVYSQQMEKKSIKCGSR
jgi:hypothetical protein